MPRMLREIIAGLVGLESDLQLVGEIGSADELSHLDDSNVPDVVIAGEDPAVGAAAAGLLRRHPRLRVLEVVAEGRSANIYELRPAREFVAQISPDSLLGALRGGPA